MTVIKYIVGIAVVVLELIAFVEGSRSWKQKGIRRLGKQTSSPRRIDTQVFIGGAGFSGISAAQEFHDAGVTFWIAEATDRVGGRMYGDLFGKAGGKQYRVEFGANWVQGLTGNPVWEMAQEYGLDGTLTDFFNARVYDDKGKLNITETLFADGSNCGNLANAYTALEELSSFCLQLNEGESFVNDTVKQFCLNALGAQFVPSNNDDISCENGFLATTGFYPPKEQNPALARVCEWFALDIDFVELPRVSSTIETIPDYNTLIFDEDNYYVRDQRGYKWLVERTGATFLSTSTNTADTIIFNDPRLNLRTKVVKVQWDPKGQNKVQVTLCQTEKVVLPNSPVLYPCIANKKYITVTSKYFFSTFSLGVLKASVKAERQGQVQDLKKTRDVAPVFEPPLSSVPALANAIRKLGYSVFQKVYFQFPFAFWPKGVELFLTAYAQGKWVGDFAPGWLSLDLHSPGRTQYFPGSNMLVLIVTGDRAIELASMTDDAIIAQILPVLNLMFAGEIQAANGGMLLSPSDILDFYLYRWHADPLFRGTFSTNIVNTPVSLLGDRYGNLVFSGELTCHQLNGYVHGAYLAGKRSARMLLSRRFGVKGLNLTSICDA